MLKFVTLHSTSFYLFLPYTQLLYTEPIVVITVNYRYASLFAFDFADASIQVCIINYVQ